MSQQGPAVRIEANCNNCTFCENESYACQGDSGFRVYCAHPDIVAESELRSRRRIGDTTWTTPQWCPLLTSAIAELLTRKPQP